VSFRAQRGILAVRIEWPPDQKAKDSSLRSE
jgi:hypothetical protein